MVLDIVRKMAVSYLTEALERVAAMLEEAVPNSHAEPRWYYAQSKFPYFRMRIAPYKPEIDSEQIEYREYVLVIQYVVGNVTSLASGVETTMYENVPIIESFFAQRLQLQCQKFPEPMDSLDVRGNYLTLSTGLMQFPVVSGIPAQEETGCEFRTHLSFAVNVDQLF